MSEKNHYHKDCVECLQAEVGRLQAALDGKEEVDTEELNREALGNKIEVLENESKNLEANLARTIIERDTAIVELDRLRGRIELEQRQCIQCGYPQEKHSVGGICPAYIDSSKIFKA